MKTAGRTFMLLLLLTTVGCNRVTKHLAATMLAGKPSVTYLADTFRMEYTENAGAFMSMGSGLSDWTRIALLTAGAGVGLLGIAVAAIKFRWIGLSNIGVVLLTSGGASNLTRTGDQGMEGAEVVGRAEELSCMGRVQSSESK